jgi:hypothetical protein
MVAKRTLSIAPQIPTMAPVEREKVGSNCRLFDADCVAIFVKTGSALVVVSSGELVTVIVGMVARVVVVGIVIFGLDIELLPGVPGQLSKSQGSTGQHPRNPFFWHT